MKIHKKIPTNNIDLIFFNDLAHAVSSPIVWFQINI